MPIIYLKYLPLTCHSRVSTTEKSQMSSLILLFTPCLARSLSSPFDIILSITPRSIRMILLWKLLQMKLGMTIVCARSASIFRNPRKRRKKKTIWRMKGKSIKKNRQLPKRFINKLSKELRSDNSQDSPWQLFSM